MSPQPSGAADYAAVLRDCIQRTLLEALHATCPDRTAATYFPAEPGQPVPFVACGCGQVFDAQPLSVGAAPAAEAQVATIGGQLPALDPVQSVLALIDPGKLYTPAEVEEHILDCVSRLETGAVFERECILREHETHTEYERAFAHAMVKVTGGSADVRKAQAFVDTEAEYTAWRSAEMLAKAVKSTMHNLRSILSGYQSVAKSISGAYQGSGPR